DETGKADRRRARGRTGFSPRRSAGASRVARAPRRSPALRRLRLGLPVGALQVVHERVTAPCLQDARPLHQDLLGLYEIRASLAMDVRMDVGVHPDGVARTGLDAHPAVDALERVDLVPHRVLLDRRIGVLAGLDVNALRRARGGAEEARSAPDRAV